MRYVPEAYLTDYLHPASGVTAEDGTAVIAIAPELLSEEHARIKAVHAGVYKVEITHPSKKIPAKYNSATTIGREVSRQTRAFPTEMFELTSR